MKKCLVLLAVIVFGLNVKAQQVKHHCGTDEYVAEVIDQNPELESVFEQRRQEFFQLADQNAELSRKKTQAVVTIPVVFHILYDSPEDNISKAQILDGLRILNEDFNLQNPDASNIRAIFQSRQADAEVEFALAKIDDNGNCTDGINRISTPLAVDANPRDRVKTIVQWDPDKYLNIWVVQSIVSSSSTTGIILGFANFPWMPASTDGIVIRNDALGVIGTAAYDGRTLTHEVGHYLGLLHTFQSGCNQGDGISDTPPVASASYGCNLNKNSCNNDSPDYPDMIENFMDYSDGVCQNTFTTLQKNVMRSTLSSSQYRSQLVSASNMLATGVINPPACLTTTEFEIDNSVICPGDTVQFFDQTEDGDPDTYAWSFPGGVPNTSTDPNPIIYYPTAGAYDVTLTTANAAGTSTSAKVQVVSVKPQFSNLAQWSENFEAASLSKPEVSIISGIDSTTYRLTNKAGNNSSQSLFLNNFQAETNQDIDEFISPSIQTIFGQNLTLSFDYAYTKKVTLNNDLFIIYVSTDCGNTWGTLRIIGAAQLTTAANNSTSGFVPSSSEWDNFSISLDKYESEGPILIKFAFRSGGGNNFYLDNINVTASNISLAEVPLNQSLSVFPNPTNGNFSVSLSHQPQSDLNLVIYDLYGKQVSDYTIDKNTSLFNIENLNLASGIYVLSFTDGEDTYSQKLIIE
ncbi:M43 family zinc metalloprotease [Owenweeksia hongkongensis]|uniref:M43 family zinc metalloprotease n=1 Tax=Owenweeksia hongkongensis TaxID=253245 RepID=UPI003A8E644F